MYNLANSNSYVAGYLDHATTSWPKAPGVVEAMAWTLTDTCASPGRSNHRLAREVSALVEKARERVTEVFRVKRLEDVIFTSGATMALNLAIKGLLMPGDHVIATCFDHNSVLRPLMRMEREGCKVTIVRRCDPDMMFVDAVIREFRPETRLVVVNHASNVCGTLLPCREIGSAARSRGITVLLDAAQTAGHVPIDLLSLPVDLVAFSGHKGLLGPPGIGCLLVNNPNLALVPLLEGGTGLQSESLVPQMVFPTSFEVGTQNAPAIAGLGAALEFVTSENFNNARENAGLLYKKCLERLYEMPHVRVHGHSQLPSIPIISFTIKGMLPEEVANILDSEHNIQVRDGLHCAPLAHEALGTFPYGTVRIAFGYGNTDETVDQLCYALVKLRQ